MIWRIEEEEGGGRERTWVFAVVSRDVGGCAWWLSMVGEGYGLWGGTRR